MVKKVLILIAFIYISVSNAFAGVSIITDTNETLKRTRGESLRGMYHAFLTHKMFGSMETLIDYMGDYAKDLYIVSSSYNFLKFNVESLVEEHNLKPREIFTRAPFKHSSEFAYKYDTVKRIFENNKDDKFILIGNDENVDQEVYTQIKRDFPGRVLEIYIHVVDNGKELLKEVTPYYTAFDVAVNEVGKGRLKRERASLIGEAIVKEQKFHKVFPGYAHCPTEAEEIRTKRLKAFDRLTNNITKKTLDFCNS